MASRQLRTNSLQETRANVRRARQLAEQYGLMEANPADYLTPPPDDFEDLLNRIK